MTKIIKNKIGLAKEAIWLTIGKVIVLAISLISSMLLSRFRTLEEYGTFSQITTIVSVISTIFVLGLPNCINYFIGKAETDEERDKFLCLYYKIVSVLSLISGVVLVFCSRLLANYYNNNNLPQYWYCLLIMPWTTTVVEGLSNMMVSFKKTKLLIFYNFFRSLSLLVIILMTKLFNGNFSSYLISYVFVDGFFAFIVYIFAARLITKYRKGIDLKLLKEILLFSIPMGISSVLSTINIKLDHLMVGAFFNTEQYAIFSNAATELPFTVIASSFTAVLIPRMVKMFKNNEYDNAISLWHEVIKFNAVILVFCSICCFAFAPYIIKILYSDKYISGFPVFQIYSLILLLRITYFGMVLNSKGKPHFILFSSLTSLIVNFILNFLFIRTFGLVGPALSTVVSLSIVGIMQLIISAKILKISFLKIFPWKFLFTLIFLLFTSVLILSKTIKLLNLDYSTTSTLVVIGIGSLFFLVYFAFWFKPLKSMLGRMKGE